PTPTSTQAPDPKELTTEYVPDAPGVPEVCTLEPDEGVCDSGMRRRDEFRYFFNPETEECEFFSYSGCNGNGNNFKTEDQCKERCRAPTAPTPTSTPNPTEPTTEYVPDAPRLPALCMLEPEQGFCDSGASGSEVFRYFFDPKTKECKFFSYSGCNGNGNNFETAEQCKERCQDLIALQETDTDNVLPQGYTTFATDPTFRTAVIVQATQTAQTHTVPTTIDYIFVELLPRSKTQASLYVLKVYNLPNEPLPAIDRLYEPSFKVPKATNSLSAEARKHTKELFLTQDNPAVDANLLPLLDARSRLVARREKDKTNRKLKIRIAKLTTEAEPCAHELS
ncbi:serine proteinase inhibitor, putative, partial [Ixodes scapularis]